MVAESATTRIRPPEQFKARSQNLGHEGVLTTFYNYGEVGSQRQSEIILTLAESRQSDGPDVVKIAKALARELRGAGPIE